MTPIAELPLPPVADKRTVVQTTEKTKPKATIAEWKKIIATYTTPSLSKAIWQLVNTLVPFVGLWYLMYLSLDGPYWITFAIGSLAGLFLVRVFIIFHDCGHGSFFKSKLANDIVGFITGMFTFTPYGHWTWQHAVHHQTSGDLDRRGAGDIWTMTVDEYLAAPKRIQILYRLARNPVIMFGVAPLAMFWIYQRFPSPGAKGRDRSSVMWMNLALVGMIAGISYGVGGFSNYLWMQLPVTLVGGAVGIWMFYVQHQFEEVYWERREDWDYTTAALQGSSFYKLPKPLQWISGNIGFHHIHHLSSRIPNYHLEACHHSHPLFSEVPPITLGSSLKCASLRLFDEKNKRLVGYDHLRELKAKA